ncbi:hypothetical protein N7468_001716 [Penicillium chermesinum]|uniref:Uncharacterized protein n=1 Tax=Penicillium chermesinum TaxID=63820 RepID=A0A9W9PJA4_9EURO|nr:uncharacterized protein N7468_001716 [Penicillium chermesinum]KAJ5246733.1 hypothetical protein N7468_001716 [Penicillium chermesinum]
MSKPAIGFVGLGAMGFGMATQLVKQGYPVHGFDESASGKQYYVCMVATAAQAQSALFGEAGIVSALPNNATLILTSTVPASYAQSVAAELQSIGRGDILFIDARSLAAQFVLHREPSQSWLLYLVPGGVGAGSNMKMVHQVLAGIHILGGSEAMGFAAQLGLDATKAAEAIKASDAWSWMHENRLQRLLEEDWHPGASAISIILKDVGIITSSARQNQFPLPLCTSAEQVYLSAVLQGNATVDDASMVRHYYNKPVLSVSDTRSATETAEALQLVLDMMEVTNLVAAAEAVAFARHLKVDLKQFFTLVSDAAGSSRQFVTKGLEMIEGRIGEKAGSPTISDAIARLEKAVQKARDLHCPLYLGNSALNVLFLAKRAGLEKESSSSVIKVFGSN